VLHVHSSGDLFVTRWHTLVQPFLQKGSIDIHGGNIIMYVGKSDACDDVIGHMFLDTCSLSLFVLPISWLNSYGGEYLKKVYDVTTTRR
jgi:hypothetical protein